MSRHMLIAALYKAKESGIRGPRHLLVYPLASGLTMSEWIHEQDPKWAAGRAEKWLRREVPMYRLGNTQIMEVDVSHAQLDYIARLFGR